MAEGFAALLTREGLLTSVDSLVGIKGCTLTKGPSTFLTSEGLLTSVNSHVLCKVNGLFEHFFTYITSIHSGSYAAHWITSRI